MAISSEYNAKVSVFLIEMEQIADEVKKNGWTHKEGELCKKVNELLKETMNSLYGSDAKNLDPASLKNSFESLSTSIQKQFEKTTSKQVKSTIQALQFASKKELPLLCRSSAGVSVELAKTLPSTGDEDIKKSLSVLRKYLQMNTPGAALALAQWINRGRVSLDRLSLTPQERSLICDNLNVLKINLTINPQENLDSLINEFKNITDLDVIGGDMVELKELPKQLKSLTLMGCGNLKTIKSLPEGLDEFNLINCELIRELPESTPNSLKVFNCIDCSYLEKLPRLNEGLEDLTCSGCVRLKLPSTLPRGLKYLNTTDCSIKALPKLPPDLRKLICLGCQNLTALPPLPENLEELDCRSCIQIEKLPDELPKKIKLFIRGCESLKLDINSLPLEVKVIK